MSYTITSSRTTMMGHEHCLVTCTKCGCVVEDSEKARDQHDWTHMSETQRIKWAMKKSYESRNEIRTGFG